MNYVAIITARGGSKRIPKKNIKEFCGKPIIAYSIEAAIKSGMFTEIMVSTDSEEIANIAKQYGAKVPFMRSEKASDDFATTTDVISEVLSQYEKENICFDRVCCIYPTAPFVTAQRLQEANQILNDTNADSVFPVVQFSFPPQRCMEIENNNMFFTNKQYAFTRSQDLKPLYHDCGQFYFMNVPAFLSEKGLVLNKTAPLILPETEVQDIDNLTDWEIAELKYKMFIK